MTNREFMTAIMNGTEITSEMREFAQTQIDKLDAKNANRRNTLTKAQKENLELIESIKGFMQGGEVYTAAMIAEAVEVTTQKASAMLRKIVANGEAEVTDVKVGSRKSKGYILSE